MNDSNVTVLANLFAQVGPLITRVNELKQEMEQLKAQLANCSPELGKRTVEETSPPDAPFKKYGLMFSFPLLPLLKIQI